jgi:hypothetical protein
MRKLLLLFFLLSCPALPSASAGPVKELPLKEKIKVSIPKVKSKSLQTICNNSKSTFLIVYPQLESFPAQPVQKMINRYLQKEFTKFRNGSCSDDNQGSSYQEEIDYQVKMRTNSILSIYYTNSGYLHNAAYPNNIIYAYNFSLKTGRLFTLKNLFKNDINYLNRLNYLVKKSLESQNIDIEFQDATHDFDFYLTEKQLVLINIFDFHAAQGIEVPIDYSGIKDIIDKNGPLKFVN